LKDGIGRLVYGDKSEYYGEWKKGKKEGEGMYIYANKDVYSGKWLNGKKHGTGTYVFNATGMKYIG
jgi:radial spoke head protein 1